MDDITLHERINALSREEEALYREANEGPLAPAQLDRLHAIARELEQSWDLLRQRQALEAVGMDPDEAHLRPVELVEAYEQ